MAAARKLNTTALAFMGDAVYEVYVRKHVLETGSVHSDVLHREAVKYVSAEGQAHIIKILMELTVVKRARNHKQIASKRIKSSKRGSDPVTDKLATAFEALIGQLYLDGDEERLNQLINRSFEIIKKR